MASAEVPNTSIAMIVFMFILFIMFRDVLLMILFSSLLRVIENARRLPWGVLLWGLYPISRIVNPPALAEVADWQFSSVCRQQLAACLSARNVSDSAAVIPI